MTSIDSRIPMQTQQQPKIVMRADKGLGNPQVIDPQNSKTRCLKNPA